MSSIMDRLRQVEGVGSTRAQGGETKEDARRREEPAVPQESREESDRKAAWGATTYRILAGVLAIVVVLFLWRPWRGETPGRLPRGRQAVSPSRTRIVENAGAAAGQTLLASAKQVRDNSAENELGPLPGSVSAVPSERNVAPTPSPSEEKADVPQASPDGPERAETSAVAAETGPEGETVSPGGQVSQEGEVAEAAVRAEDTLTQEEDARAKTLILGLKVSGVYKDANGYVALINGREFQRGDTVGRVEILEIASKKITFGLKGKRYNLSLRW